MTGELVLDAQVHAWYSDRPSRPWVPEYRQTHWNLPTYLIHAGQTNSPDMVRSEMDEAGVDGALLTPIGTYGTNLDMELEAAEEHPDRFQVIGLVDHLSPTVSQDIDAAAQRGMRGVRMIGMREPERVARGEFETVLATCAERGLVVMLSISHPLDPQLPELFKRHSGVVFYLDHLGTGYAPPILGFRPERPFEHLSIVTSLSDIPNVCLKLTGAPALSRETFPFRDVWGPVKELVSAFGADRVSWGSDFTRVAAFCSYWEGVHYLREMNAFSHEELALIYGQTLMQKTAWSPESLAGHPKRRR